MAPYRNMSCVSERKPLWVPWIGWACARARVTVKRMSIGLCYLIHLIYLIDSTYGEVLVRKLVNLRAVTGLLLPTHI